MAILLHRVTVINMKIILVVALILCKNRSIVFVLPMLCLVCFFFWLQVIKIDVKHVSGGGYRRVFIYLTIYASALLLLIGYLLDLGMESANHNSIKF
jgi:hypothetical protein